MSARVSVAAALALLLLGAPVACAQEADPAAGHAALRAGDYDRAVEILSRAVDQEVGGEEAAVGLVEALTEVGRYDVAAEMAAEYLADQPGATALYVPLGRAHLARGRADAAADAFRAARAAGAPDSLSARLELALLAWRQGERDAALRELDAFIDLYNAGVATSAADLVAVGRAVRLLGRGDPELFRDALLAYDQASERDPAAFEPRIRAGELFLEKYNGADAQASFEEVLAVNPRHPRALLGLARTSAMESGAAELKPVMDALEVNPDLVGARVLLARHRLISEDYDGAIEELERALGVDSTSVEALAVLAAVHHLGGDEAAYRGARARALAAQPKTTELFTILAELAVQHRRYADAVAFAREAVAQDPRAWEGQGLLGVNLLRTGEIEEGRERLAVAFAGDPYNVWIKNTLDLLDTFERYEVRRTPHFELVLHESEAELLGPWMEALAEEAYESLVARYGTAPPTPIRVEVYPRHADFSVRTVGLVGMGALGVSFGSVLAMDSPSSRDPGHFNWGSTLWHEIAHSVHLAMTGHRTPRWLTEGLAVLEERRARPGWGDDVSLQFLETYKRGGLLPVSRLSEGFIRPSFPEQLAFSYYQASLVAEMIEEAHGFAAVRGILADVGAGRSTAEALRRATGMAPDALDDAFDAWLRARFATPLAAIQLSERAEGARESTRPVRGDETIFKRQLAIGGALLQQGKAAEAIPYLERAAALFPQYGGGDSPHRMLGEAYQAAGQREKAAAALARYTTINENDLEAHRALAALRRALGDPAGAAETLERTIWITPFDRDVHTALAELSEEGGRWPAAVRARRALVALEPVDRAGAWFRLATAQVAAGDRAGARTSILRSLELAPEYEAAQELLLELRGVGR